MTDEPKKPKHSGHFVKNDPRRSIGGAARKTESGKSLPSMARLHSEEALNIVIEALRDPDCAWKDKLKAVDLLWKRGWGAPNQTISIEGQIQHAHLVASIDPTMLTADMRQQLLAAKLQSETQPLLIEAPVFDSEGDDE
jgi:hypothetical protein